MYCKKCAQLLVPDGEKALSGEIQEVWRSQLTNNWICKVDGNEHAPGSLEDWARRVQTTMYGIQNLMETKDLDAEAALRVILTDAGLIERSDFAVRLSEAQRSEDPARLMEILEESG